VSLNNPTLETIAGEAERAVREARPWLVPLARLGYAAKGTVYLLVGIAATLAAVRPGAQPTDFHGVLLRVFLQPFGGALLAALALGLAGYALWCLLQAVMDTEDKGTGFAGIVTRLLFAGVGLFYGGLAYSALRLLAGAGDVSSGDKQERALAARTMTIIPYGRWLVLIAGVGCVGFCLYELRRAYKAEFRTDLHRAAMHRAEDVLVTRIGQVGIGARGAVFALIGWFLIQAAADYDPSEARGVSGALSALVRQAHGAWLLAGVALGLVAYGTYMLLLAGHRRINPA
jgi:Domain of Unknown Function (DUF1206)